MPQGGIDPKETPAEAVLREMREETGTDKGKIIARTDWLDYTYPKDLNLKEPYLGQRQKWFLIEFLGTDNDIDLTTDTYQEFDDFKWVDLKETVNLIVSWKKEVYEKIYQTFSPILKKF